MSGQALAALADPTRRELLERLARGEASATTLARDLPISRQAVVQHLGVLDAAGLVRSARYGREVRWSPRRDGLIAAAVWLTGLAEEWDRRLAAIKAIAEEG
ncbi:metalloregulator ArsR/SmtB family transcription factor [Pseudonocardia yuanmonensis]|uniref:Metalloregulator ArsR/SmtB family transcription factor n=1 Tax=Pseudonocardia yuanmonensis TaxID=1095914 RepID=A0ABP8XVP2_9PSEU